MVRHCGARWLLLPVLWGECCTIAGYLNVVFEPLSGTTLISFASSELTIKQMTRYAVTVHSNGMPHPAKLSLKQHSFDAGGVGALQDFQIGDTILPANS